MPAKSPNSPAAGRDAKTCRASIRWLLLPAVLAAGLSSAAYAESGALSIADPWMRYLMASRPAAGYFTLSNGTAETQTLVDADSPACGNLMLHKSIDQGGQEQMVMVKRVPVPAHGSVQFSPGGYHLMCTSPTTAVKPGGSIPVTLHFEDGGQVTADFPVRNAMGQ